MCFFSMQMASKSRSRKENLKKAKVRDDRESDDSFSDGGGWEETPPPAIPPLGTFLW